MNRRTIAMESTQKNKTTTATVFLTTLAILTVLILTMKIAGYDLNVDLRGLQGLLPPKVSAPIVGVSSETTQNGGTLLKTMCNVEGDSDRVEIHTIDFVRMPDGGIYPDIYANDGNILYDRIPKVEVAKANQAKEYMAVCFDPQAMAEWGSQGEPYTNLEALLSQIGADPVAGSVSEGYWLFEINPNKDNALPKITSGDSNSGGGYLSEQSEPEREELPLVEEGCLINGTCISKVPVNTNLKNRTCTFEEFVYQRGGCAELPKQEWAFNPFSYDFSGDGGYKVTITDKIDPEDIDPKNPNLTWHTGYATPCERSRLTADGSWSVQIGGSGMCLSPVVYNKATAETQPLNPQLYLPSNNNLEMGMSPVQVEENSSICTETSWLQITSGSYPTKLHKSVWTYSPGVQTWYKGLDVHQCLRISGTPPEQITLKQGTVVGINTSTGKTGEKSFWSNLYNQLFYWNP